MPDIWAESSEGVCGVEFMVEWNEDCQSLGWGKKNMGCVGVDSVLG